MRSSAAFVFLLGFLGASAPLPSYAADHPSGFCKKKKKKKKALPEEEETQGEGDKAEEKTDKEPAKEEPAQKSDEKPAEAAPDQESEQKRVEEAKKKLKVEGRKESEITPGSASRWSNRGAMTPIVAEVPITVPLPERAKPVAAGTVETPGQSLTGSEEVLQARLYFFGYHLETKGQDQVIRDMPGPGTAEVTPGQSRTFDLYRGRASLAYEHVANSNFGAHMDLEYRTKASGNVPTDHRINEAYISYGLVDFRKTSGPDFGIALGRVAIREAGYAQADGLAARLRIGPDLNFGAFGGVTGNPYGYNWQLAQNEEFSTKWTRGGAFLAYRSPSIFLNASGVLTYANISSGRSGIDRAYAYVDGAFLVTESLNIFATGWLDVINGVPIQNMNLVASFNPSDDFSLRLSAGRFSTLVYSISNAYTFAVDRFANKGGLLNPNAVIVDENGMPIVPYDAVRATAIYNDLQLSAGVRPIRTLEIYASGEVLMRDTSSTDQANTSSVGATLQFSKVRIQPAAGVRYRNPALFDANAQFTYIIDPVSQARALIQAGVGRGWEGLYGMADLRYIFGDIPGLDGGLEVTYTFPKDWFPGRVILRGLIRYYRESVSLDRPILTPVPMQPNPKLVTTTAPAMTGLTTVPAQESYLGLLGVEWRF